MFSIRNCRPDMSVAFPIDRKSTRLNSSHSQISYAVFCLKKKTRFIRICQTAAPSPVPTTIAVNARRHDIVRHHRPAGGGFCDCAAEPHAEATPLHVNRLQ